jgi:hypothetical protein
MKEAFYDMKDRRVYVNNEHLILAKADMKQKRKQEKRARDLEAQQKAKTFRENSKEAGK